MEKDRSKQFKHWSLIAKNLMDVGYEPPHPSVRFQIPKAAEVLESAYRYCLSLIGQEAKYCHTPEIDKLAAWLSNNNGKGLLLYGQCGRGKTFFVRYVLPLIFKSCNIGLISYYDMTYASRHTDDILSDHMIILDDIGTEQRFNDYGTVRHTLDEVIDLAEKRGRLVILTSNLTGAELKQFYGERVFDRICSITERIPFTGTSFRQAKQ